MGDKSPKAAQKKSTQQKTKSDAVKSQKQKAMMAKQSPNNKKK